MLRMSLIYILMRPTSNNNVFKCWISVIFFLIYSLWEIQQLSSRWFILRKFDLSLDSICHSITLSRLCKIIQIMDKKLFFTSARNFILFNSAKYWLKICFKRCWNIKNFCCKFVMPRSLHFYFNSFDCLLKITRMILWYYLANQIEIK